MYLISTLNLRYVSKAIYMVNLYMGQGNGHDYKNF